VYYDGVRILEVRGNFLGEIDTGLRVYEYLCPIRGYLDVAGGESGFDDVCQRGMWMGFRKGL